MKKITLGLSILSLLLLSGCSEKSGVYASGSGTHSITNQAATGFSGKQDIRTNAYKQAATFCRNKGRDFEVIKMDENEGPYILGKYPRVTLQFKCK
jgi:protein involved in sex pheromone biosynthesis